MHNVGVLPGRLLVRAGRRLMAGALAAGILAAAAACGTSAAQVALPKKPSRLQLAGIGQVRQSVRQEVVTAYEGYWLATSQALDSRNAASARSILAGYIPGSAVAGLVKGLSALWRRHEIAYGSPVFHIMSVTITGRGTAAVHDCIDLSHTGFQDARTGLVIGGLGQSHYFLITTLAREHGRWLVTGAIPVVQTCEY